MPSGIAKQYGVDIAVGVYFMTFADPLMAFHGADYAVTVRLSPYSYNVLCESGLQTKMNSSFLSSTVRQKARESKDT
ncbi:MAG: hypothetical protein ACXW02_06825 [Halobacteriota archaeon]